MLDLLEFDLVTGNLLDSCCETTFLIDFCCFLKIEFFDGWFFNTFTFEEFFELLAEVLFFPRILKLTIHLSFIQSKEPQNPLNRPKTPSTNFVAHFRFLPLHRILRNGENEKVRD